MLDNAMPLASIRPEFLYCRGVRFIENPHRFGVVGKSRYSLLLCKAQKLWRFLVINGLTGLSASIPS